MLKKCDLWLSSKLKLSCKKQKCFYYQVFINYQLYIKKNNINFIFSLKSILLINMINFIFVTNIFIAKNVVNINEKNFVFYVKNMLVRNHITNVIK